MEFRADLHCHSTHSDGTFTPMEIVDLAKEIGLSGLAITDHDCVDAYPSIFGYAKENGIQMVSGVEFSSVHREVSVHILGYAFSPSHEAIVGLCERHKERRAARYRGILEMLRKHGMPLTEDEVKQESTQGIIGRPHIALAMMKKGYIHSVDEAFKRYIAEGRPCYVKGNAFSVEETLEAIHQAGGLAVIAHPQLINSDRVVRELLTMNFDGLEGYYARFDKSIEQRWIEKAKKNDWMITGGSDFHGSVKPHIPLGCSWVNEEIFNVLKERFLQTGGQ